MRHLMALLFLLFTWHVSYGAGRQALSDLKDRLMQSNKADSADLAVFADECFKADSSGLFITTYKTLVSAKKWSRSPADLPLLERMYETIDTTRPKETDIVICQMILRIYGLEHLDPDKPFAYLTTAKACARRLNDKCLMVSVYKGYFNIYADLKHDMLKTYETLIELQTYARKNSIDLRKDCGLKINMAWAAVYYYLQDFDKSIDYLAKEIREAPLQASRADIFDLYVRKAIIELERSGYTASLIALDSAHHTIRNEKDQKEYLNFLYADSFNVYVEMGDIERAAKLKDKIDISTLGKENDEFYDHAYRLIKYYTYTKNYKEAQQLASVYKMGLKPWNIQRWKNYYASSYKLNSAMGNAQQALSDYERYTVYNDSVHHQTKHNAVLAQQIRYHTLQKEKELDKQMSINEVQSKNIKLIIFVSISVFLLLVIALFYRTNKSLRERAVLNKAFAQRLMENTEQTQTRLAHELHDGLGQELLLLRNGLSLQLDAKHADAVSGIIENVRGMARELYPALLDVVGLKATIENQLQKLDETEDIFVSHEIEMEVRPGRQTELQVYRIFQEAITNVLKYAGATSVYVGLHTQGRQGKLVIKDNGKGFDAEAQMKDPGTFGLKSMQQRAESINALLTISSVPGKGTEIDLIFAIDENTHS